VRQPIEIAPGVYGLGSEMINWYLVEEGGKLSAVDAGLPGFARDLEAGLASLGLKVGDVEAVVLTHSDADHTGIAPRLQAAGARVLIHAADEAALRKPGPKGGDASPRHLLANLWRPAVLKIMRHTLQHGGAKPAKVQGAERYSAGDVLDVPGSFRVVHTPGHTAGHCALLSERSRTLFVGDALCAHHLMTGGRGPQVMPRFLNEDHRQALASLDAIAELDADTDRLLFGHGDPWRQGARQAVASARG